jgi:aminopeptidase N
LTFVRILCLAACLTLPAMVAAQSDNPGPGVPRVIAESRAARLSNVRYALRLSIPESPKDPIEGTNLISFDQIEPAIPVLSSGRDGVRTFVNFSGDPLVIDFATSREHVKSVTLNGRRTAFTWTNGHIVLPGAEMKDGSNQIEIAFRAGDASLNRSGDFLYALFVPARAHLAIPCFDQPDLKARWSLSLEAPAKWVTVSNGAEVERRVTGDRASVRFAETELLSTYLFSFVVGDFRTETAERAGRTFRMFHRETDAEKVARNKDAIFDLHANAIAYMEEYTGIPYAFGKFDFVLIPAFQFSGMEHAGKILYNAPGLLLDESATQNQYLNRASVIAHETAHMWFGDLVTMKWFNDVWMKEVFANFMAAKIVNPSFPELNHELRFLLAHYPAAYEVDRTRGTNAIRQELDNLSEAGSLYGAIIYQKAPVVMRHLENLMGEVPFRDGLREYLTKNSFANATWSDLIDILDRRTPADLAAWSRVWVEERGRPTISTNVTTRDGRIETLSFSQTDAMFKRLIIWPQQLRVTLGYEKRIEQVLVSTDAGSAVVAREAIGKPEPLYVLPNGQGWAYGRFVLDDKSRAYLLLSLPDIGDPLTRGAAWVTLWDEMLDDPRLASVFFDLAMKALPLETDEQLTQRVLAYLRAAWWRFLSSGDRQSRQARVEAFLRAGMVSAKTASLKSAWFSAIRDVGMNRDTLTWLQRVWEKKESIAGLPLAEPDYSSLAQDLAVREVPGWRDILETQRQRIENPDRKARFEFVMPSLSADPTEREHWFLSLQDVANRRREPWVLEGLSNLHHPLRAAASTKYVRPSLEMLREIQRTGDIFFPTRWINSTLAGHNSPAVATTVQQFLDGLPPTYPERLRNIILQAADELVRAAAVQ